MHELTSINETRLPQTPSDRKSVSESTGGTAHRDECTERTERAIALH